MHRSTWAGLSLSALLGAALLFSTTSCSKTEMEEGPGGATHPGATRGRALVNRLVAAIVPSGTTTYTFTVTRECDCPFGTLACTGTSSPIGSAISSQNSTTVTCQGTSPHGNPPNNSACVLQRGENSSNDGPIYYVKPSSGTGKVLMIRIKGGTLPTDPDHTWFTYNVANNTWAADEQASIYFTWSVLTSQPTYCCGAN
jgi:hypothetical protein